MPTVAFFPEPYQPAMITKQRTGGPVWKEMELSFNLGAYALPAPVSLKDLKTVTGRSISRWSSFLSPSLIVSPQSRREEETHSFLAWRKEETRRQRWTSEFTLHGIVFSNLKAYRDCSILFMYTAHTSWLYASDLDLLYTKQPQS